MIGERFRNVYKTMKGRRFYGDISDAPTSTPSGLFEYPRRILTVATETNLPLGTVFTTAEGRKFLVCDNGEGDQFGFFDRTYRLLQVDRYVTWERDERVTDLVTGLPKQLQRSSLGSFWTVFEPIGDQMGEIHVPKRKFRMFCGEAIQVDDVISGTMRVEKVDTVLGVQLAVVG